MAVAIANVSSVSDDTWGRHRVRVVKVTFDASYPTGGETFTPQNAGLASFETIIVSPDTNTNPTVNVRYNYTTSKLMAFVAAGTEVPDTTDLSTLVARILCIGS